MFQATRKREKGTLCSATVITFSLFFFSPFSFHLRSEVNIGFVEGFETHKKKQRYTLNFIKFKRAYIYLYVCVVSVFSHCSAS